MKNFWTYCLSMLIGATYAQAIFTEAQTREIRNIIITSLQETPEIIPQAIKRAREKEELANTASAETYLNDHISELLQQTAPYTIGPESAQITVIDFIDYRCGYCQTMYQDLAQLKSPIPIKTAYFQLPILGTPSTKIATLALSATKEQFEPLNKALFAAKGALGDDELIKIAQNNQISLLSNEELQAKLKTNFTWATELGVQGVPALIVTNGTKSVMFFGKVSPDVLLKAIQTLSPPPSTDTAKPLIPQGE